MKAQRKILFVANDAKEHIMKFHIPTIKMLINDDWQVDVACGGKDIIGACHHQFTLPISRSPLKTHWLEGYRMLKNIIDKGHYDIVYSHTSVGATLARFAARDARKKGTKHIKFAHGTYFFKNAPLYYWLYYPLYKYFSFVTDVIITITEEDFLFTKKHFSHAKAYLVDGIGVDINRFNKPFSPLDRQKYRRDLNIPSNAICLIYCAELIKNKNQKLLLDALRISLKRIDNLYLLLPGFDHINGKYERYAKQIGVYEHVRFLGWRNDVYNLYKTSDICVASSIREGFGLNLVEAMLCGLPIIATDNSGHASIIEDGINGYLIKLGDSESFADRIILLANNSDLRKKLNASAKAKIDKYSSDTILNKIKTIFYTTIAD